VIDSMSVLLEREGVEGVKELLAELEQTALVCGRRETVAALRNTRSLHNIRAQVKTHNTDR
jgi:hypothetical protein